MAGIKLEERHRRSQMRHEMAMMALDEARVNQALKLFESLPEFAQDTDENDWVLASGTEKKAYTEQELDNHRKQARILQYRPAGRNILQTMQDFIIGKTAKIRPEDESEEVAKYWDAWVEANSFDMKSKEIVRRVIRDGEIFQRWFPPPTSDGHLQLRFVDPSQIKASSTGKPTYGIETDPDDYERVVSYHRAWSTDAGTTREEQIDPSQMDHWKILVDSDVKRGVSFFIGIAKYMTAYDKWIEDRIKLNRIRHIWNVVAEPVSGATAISDLKAKFADVTAEAPYGKEKKKQAPRPGSILFSKGIKWDLKGLNIHANDTKEDGRAIQLMIALGTNLPEYITRGDASNANYSSSMVSESPFVRAMESWQDLFEKVFKGIYKRVIRHGLANGAIPANSKKTTVGWDFDKSEDIEKTEEVETSTDCSVNFATLIHRDLKQDTEAVQIHISEGMCSKRTAAEKFGYDWDAEQEQIAREQAKEEEDAKRRAEVFGPPPGQQPAGQGRNQPPEDED